MAFFLLAERLTKYGSSQILGSLTSLDQDTHEHRLNVRSSAAHAMVQYASGTKVLGQAGWTAHRMMRSAQLAEVCHHTGCLERPPVCHIVAALRRNKLTTVCLLCNGLMRPNVSCACDAPSRPHSPCCGSWPDNEASHSPEVIRETKLIVKSAAASQDHPEKHAGRPLTFWMRMLCLGCFRAPCLLNNPCAPSMGAWAKVPRS